MAVPDPEQAHFIMEHLGKILIAVSGIFLGIAKLLKGASADKAKMACDVIRDKPVLMADLLQCKLDVNTLMDSKLKAILEHSDAGFAQMERTIIREVKNVHKRVDGCQQIHMREQ